MTIDITQDLVSEAFWELTDEQIDLLRQYGEVVAISPGQTLFQQGDATGAFYVVLAGLVELVEPTGGCPAPSGCASNARSWASSTC